MFLSKRDNQRVRSIAASLRNEVNSENQTLSNDERLRIAKVRAEDRIRERFKANRAGFSSVISAIFISLLIRFASKMIERWLEKKLFSVSEGGDE